MDSSTLYRYQICFAILLLASAGTSCLSYQQLTVIFKHPMEIHPPKHGLQTEPDQEFAKLACKVVASIESSAANHSAESKVEEVFNFGHARPFDDQVQISKGQCNKNLQRLQEELDSIDKLKLEYESRNDSRLRTFNTQTSEKSRSLEKKHLLKPSQVPFLTRRVDPHSKEADKQPTQSQKRLGNFTKKVQLKSVGKVESKLEDDSKESQIQIQALKEQVLRLQQQVSDKNGAIDSLNSSMAELRREREESEEESQSIKEENRILKLDLQRAKLQKEQLETILKELLYEREKEKLLHPRQKENQVKSTNLTGSNATSSRKSITPGKYILTRPSPRNENSNTNHLIEKPVSNSKPGQAQKVVSRVPLQQISNSQDAKKMRVQNILHNLKIKINKN